MRKHVRAGVTAAALALAVFGAACGNPGSNPERADSSAPRTTTTTAPATREPSTTLPAEGPVELEHLLEELTAGTELPALGVTVFNGTEIVESAVTGVRRLGDPTPAELTDQFHIGSNTKAVTATLVALFVDDGEVSWDTTVGDVFEGVIADLHPDFVGVTIRQLLTHTAGLDDYLGFGPLLENADLDKPVMEQRFDTAAITLTRPAHHPAGEFMYSNIGYTLVGAMLEELTGVSWEDLVRTRIFDRLGMDSCGFYAPGTPGQVDQPWGHFTDLNNQAMDPGDPDAEYPHVLAPAGMIHCNMADWAVFLQSQLRGFRGSTAEIISPEAFMALRTPPPGSDYALGWLAVPETPLGLLLTHNGSNDRFMSETLLAPDAEWGVLVVTNMGEVVAAPTVRATIDAMVTRHLAPEIESQP